LSISTTMESGKASALNELILCSMLSSNTRNSSLRKSGISRPLPSFTVTGTTTKLEGTTMRAAGFCCCGGVAGLCEAGACDPEVCGVAGDPPAVAPPGALDAPPSAPSGRGVLGGFAGGVCPATCVANNPPNTYTANSVPASSLVFRRLFIALGVTLPIEVNR